MGNTDGIDAGGPARGAYVICKRFLRLSAIPSWCAATGNKEKQSAFTRFVQLTQVQHPENQRQHDQMTVIAISTHARVNWIK
ncbi:MAG: hypothetical protein J2P48_16515 [Alphaproteobacteria bacterium]|nr:hypothetical protein [Alphaproteobacteria bacterium]